MKKFTYCIEKENGRKKKGFVYAIDEQNAKELIPYNKSILSLVDRGEEYHPPEFLAEKVKKTDLANMFDSVYMLLGTGYPMDKCFYTIARMGPSRIRRIANLIYQDMQDGVPVYESFYNHKNKLRRDFSNQIKPAKSTGSMNQVFKGIADQLKSEAKIEGKVKGAMITPIMMTGMTIFMLIFAVMYMFPKVVEILDGMGKQAPPILNSVISFGTLCRDNWIMTILCIAVLVLAVILLLKGPMSYWWNVKKSKIPFIGEVLVGRDIISLYRNLGYAILSEMSVLDSLANSVDSVTNKAFKKQLTKSCELLANGTHSIYEVFSNSSFISLTDIQSIRIGFETSSLGTQLLRMADIQEEKLEDTVNNLQEALKPAMELIFGAIMSSIGVIMYAVVYTAILI